MLLDLLAVDVRRDLQRERHVAAVLVGQARCSSFSWASSASSSDAPCSWRRFLVFGDEMFTVT